MKDENNEYFKEALADFAYDMACGAQIRHLADLGHSVRQICGELDVSVPYQKVRETVNEHLYKTGVLCVTKPGVAAPAKTTFVREYDGYGRASFRQVALQGKQAQTVHWKEVIYDPSADGKLLDFLTKKTKAGGENASYISCDFGCDKQRMESSLKVLGKCHQDYLEGVSWGKTRIYHRLTPCIIEIISCLYKHGLYEGEGFFSVTGEHIIFSQKELIDKFLV